MSIALKSLIEGKDLAIQKVDKSKTVAIIERFKYLEWIKPLFSDSNKFMQFPFEEDSG